MKKYEKLAEEYTEVQPIELSHVESDWLSDAYIAGFLKAREMVYQLLEKNPRAFELDENMENLGEEQVE